MNSSNNSRTSSILLLKQQLSSFMFDDCPICLDEMANVDLEHPLQCQHHCGYNFCSHCIESLISSSKDDYLEASDGNKHVKVFLNCPQCRSDLSCTIRDTLLLRKVESYYHSKDKGLPLDESQQRLEKALATQRVQTAIKLARKQEATYLGLTVQEESEHDYGEEWGVEADLNGVHDSFHIPNPPQSVDRAEALQIDPTLFSGLDFCLQDDERKMITKQMTSGDPDILAKAAQYLWTVALHRHSNVQNNDNVTGINRRSSSNPKQLMKRSSVFSLISEAEEKKTDDTDLSRLLNADRALNSALQQLQRGLQQRAAFQTRFPLPVRMPKSIEFTSSIDGMVLMDYEWDGTVLDAYCKITIFGFRHRVFQKKTTNRNVHAILDENVLMDLPSRRVLVRQAGRVAGRLGAVRGDVVTHIDGVSVANQTAQQITDSLQDKVGKGGSPVVVTLNAERSVAEALKRRARTIADQL